jgi:carbon monoxide dehydrogenase subunit G
LIRKIRLTHARITAVLSILHELIHKIGMELNGKRNVETDPITLWNMLMDVEILPKIVPGISKLEKTGENTYKSTLEVKFGPVSGEFSGDMEMVDISHQKSFILKAQQHNKIGTVNSVMKIELIPISDNETEVDFGGEVTISGLMSTMGQKVLGAVTDMLTKQFFANLDREIAKLQRDK